MSEQALRKRLEALVKTGENRFCADCGKRGIHVRPNLHYVVIGLSGMGAAQN